LLNIFGLAIGIAACLIIMLFVQHEMSYDRFNKKSGEIVRVVFKVHMNGDNISEAHVMPPVAQTLKTDYPEVLEATRLRNSGRPKMAYGERSFKEDALAFVDSNFFEVFTLPLIRGDKRTALLEPNTIVITKEIAGKYFGKEDPIGKILTINDGPNGYKVTGLIDKIPATSHFQFGVFASMAGLQEAKENSWMRSEFLRTSYYPKVMITKNSKPNCHR
jgi:putative ABC transport system permease protein